MYEDFFGLARAPFQVTPDPEFLYLSPTHKHALSSIVSGVERRRGFILVLGDVGLGKTTVLRTYLEGLDPNRTVVAVVFDADVSFKSLLDTVFDDLGLKDKPDDVHYVVSRLHEVMIEAHHQGRNVVLVIDEAQDMPVATLERLRLLSNIETTTEKLLQIVFVGQSEFAAKLKLPELRQLRQRIAVQATLSPFTRRESLDYIEHRLNKAGATGASIFTPGALRRIVRYARGVPRLLNIVCDNALIRGCEQRQKPVSLALVNEAIGDLEGRTAATRRRRGLLWVSAAALTICAVLMLALYSQSRGSGAASARPAAARSAAPAGPSAVVPPRVALPPPLAASGTPAQPASPQGGPAGVTPPRVALSPPLAASGSPAQPASPQGGPAGVTPARAWVTVTRVVKPGDCLSKLAASVYGFGTEPVVRRVLKANPSITDPDYLIVGTPVLFPDISDLQPIDPAAAPKGR
jgi:general secretion pathway protein A